MLIKEISDVEKGMERLEGIHKHWSDEFETFEDYTLSLDLLGMKLSTLKSAQAKFDKLKETFNPDKAFPLDIFPDITTDELEEIHLFLRKRFDFPLDRLSAFIGRKYYKNFLDELSSKQEGKDTVSQFTHDLMNTEGDKT